MLYDTSIDLEANRARARLERIIAKKGLADVTDKQKRTLTQNNYAHLIMAAMAMSIHHTLQYVKEVYFKQWCNPDIFWRQEIDEISGSSYTYLRSTADLSIEEMNVAIKNFKMFAAEQNIFLPDKNDTEALLRIAIEEERYRNNF